MYRLPAEWEAQDGVLIAWPDSHTDWAYIVEEVEDVYFEVVKAISEYEKLLVLTLSPEVLKKRLEKKKINVKNIALLDIPYNDTWTRDSGPISLK
ncbi:MAG: agmatine deiminase family protein, partial [Brevinematia bacterium]